MLKLVCLIDRLHSQKLPLIVMYHGSALYIEHGAMTSIRPEDEHKDYCCLLVYP